MGCRQFPWSLRYRFPTTFPHHHPDPSRPENLVVLQNTVREHHADLGLAFDGDGDRLGVVTAKGKIIWPDRQLMLFAQDILLRNAVRINYL